MPLINCVCTYIPIEYWRVYVHYMVDLVCMLCLMCGGSLALLFPCTRVIWPRFFRSIFILTMANLHDVQQQRQMAQLRAQNEEVSEFTSIDACVSLWYMCLVFLSFLLLT